MNVKVKAVPPSDEGRLLSRLIAGLSCLYSFAFLEAVDFLALLTFVFLGGGEGT